MELSCTWWHGGYDVELPPQKPWFDSPDKPNLFSLIALLLVCKNDGGWGSQNYVQMTSAYYSRMREIEGVGMVELVYVDTLLRMGGDSLLLPVWRSVRGGFKGKGESEVWVDCSWLNLGAQGEHLTCWLTWVVA